eukprot:1158786-Pelagomonas_calceolata.AAC.18
MPSLFEDLKQRTTALPAARRSRGKCLVRSTSNGIFHVLPLGPVPKPATFHPEAFHPVSTQFTGYRKPSVKTNHCWPAMSTQPDTNKRLYSEDKQHIQFHTGSYNVAGHGPELDLDLKPWIGMWDGQWPTVQCPPEPPSDSPSDAQAADAPQITQGGRTEEGEGCTARPPPAVLHSSRGSQSMPPGAFDEGHVIVDTGSLQRMLPGGLIKLVLSVSIAEGHRLGISALYDGLRLGKIPGTHSKDMNGYIAFAYGALAYGTFAVVSWLWCLCCGNLCYTVLNFYYPVKIMLLRGAG